MREVSYHWKRKLSDCQKGQSGKSISNFVYYQFTVQYKMMHFDNFRKLLNTKSALAKQEWRIRTGFFTQYSRSAGWRFSKNFWAIFPNTVALYSKLIIVHHPAKRKIWTRSLCRLVVTICTIVPQLQSNSHLSSLVHHPLFAPAQSTNPKAINGVPLPVNRIDTVQVAVGQGWIWDTVCRTGLHCDWTLLQYDPLRTTTSYCTFAQGLRRSLEHHQRFANFLLSLIFTEKSVN